MKKLCAVVMMVLWAVGGGFLEKAGADITVGGQIDMAVVPFQFAYDETAETNKDKREFGIGLGRYAADMQGPHAMLELQADLDEVIGMRLSIEGSPEGIGFGDYVQAWWQPVEYFRIDAGRFLYDRLRGKIDDSDERMNAFMVRSYDGDTIFTGFSTHRFGQAGFMLSSTIPFGDNDLFFGAMFYDLMPLSSTEPGAVFNGHPDYHTEDVDAYRNFQAAVAYFERDYHLRAQYVGARPRVNVNYEYGAPLFSITAQRIEIGIGIVGIPGVTIDIGGKIPLSVDRALLTEDADGKMDSLTNYDYPDFSNDFKWQAPYQASFGIYMDFVNFCMGMRMDGKFAGSIKGPNDFVQKSPLELNFNIWPSYDLRFARLIVNFGMEFIDKTYDGDGNVVELRDDNDTILYSLDGGTRIGVGISLEKKFTAQCVIKGGVAWKNSTKVNGVNEKMVLSIPFFIDWYF